MKSKTSHRHKHGADEDSLNAQELKDQGNKYFLARKFDDAIRCYSKAIRKNPSVAAYFTNRALCYLKLRQWDQVCQDCRHALDLDCSSVKGHFFLGQALIELEAFDDAIQHLHRAHDLAREQKLNYGDDIASQLRVARRRRWAIQEEKRIACEIELQAHLNRLLLDEKDRQVEELTKTRNYDDVQDEMAEIEQQCDKHIAELNSMFNKLDERRRKREVPDYLCGKISFELLRDPVVTPSGVTYDRKDIEEHLLRVGHFDPVTRAPLTQDQLIPNLSMKEVVDSFLAENEWALDY